MEYPLLNWSGKVGNYVICTYRGQKYVRRRPRKKCPPTPMQRAQRERMSSIGILYKALKDAGLSPYWSTASEGQLAHGYNLVTRENLPAFCADGRICDFAKLQLTPSLLPLPDDLQLEQEADGAFRLQWTNNSCLPGAAEDDVLRLFLMRDAESFTPVAVETGNVCRGDGEARFTIPERLKDYAHLYVVFCSRTGWKSSSSRYFKIKENEKL